MKNYIENFNKKEVEKINKKRDYNIPKFSAGDTVSVKYKIIEGTNSRIQAFNGVVIAKSKDDTNYSATFTVRKISGGIGVERKFTTYSPLIANIEVLKRGLVRRSKLYYLRQLTGKASRIKEKLDFVSKDKKKSLKKNTDNQEAKKASSEDAKKQDQGE